MPADNKIDKLTRRFLKNRAPYKKYVNKKFGLPGGLPVLDLRLILPELDEIISPYTFLEGTSLPIDIAMLKGLARSYKECNYFEIGTWRGESIANVADVARKVVSLSLSEKEMKDIGLSEEFINLNRFFSRGLKNIEHIEHNSLTYDFNQINEKFDLVFIDGDHSYKAIKSDSKNVLKIIHDKSVVVWHDYGTTTESVNWEVLAAILDGIPADLHRYLYHVSNTLCAVLIRQDYPKKYCTFPSRPDKEFEVRIRMK